MVMVDPSTPDRPQRPAAEPTDESAPSRRAPAEAGFSRTQADLAEFRAGNRDAFERVWQRYRAILEALLASRIRRSLTPALRVRLDAELDDILQEAGMTVFAKLDGFEYRGPGSILAWMEQIGRHLVSDRVDYWRADKRDPRRERPLGGADTSDAGAGRGDLPHRGPGPATQHDQECTPRAVAAALDHLSERDQSFVLLKFFGDATWPELAAEIGAPSGDAARKEWSDRILPAFARAWARRRDVGQI